MVDVVVTNFHITKHCFFFSIFLLSYQLLVDCSKHKVKATGTVRQNRTYSAAKLMKGTAEKKKLVGKHITNAATGQCFFVSGMIALTLELIF